MGVNGGADPSVTDELSTDPAVIEPSTAPSDASADADVDAECGSEPIYGPGGIERRSRKRVRPTAVKRAMIAADFAALVVGAAIAFAAQALLRPAPSFVVLDHVLLVAASLPAFAAGAAINHLYLARANERRIVEAGNVIKTVFTGVAFLVLLSFGIQYDSLSRFYVGALFVCATAAILFERRYVRARLRTLREEGRMLRRIVIVGTDPHAIGLLHAYQRNPSLGYQVVGFVGDDDIGERNGVEVIGKIDELEQVLQANRVGGVVVSLASVATNEVNQLTRRLTDGGYHVALSSALRDIDVTRLRPQSLDGRTMIYVEPTIRHGWRAVAKRAYDIALAGTVFVLTLPIQALAAILITTTSKGPVFFKQVRVGKDGELFEVIKFRTMIVNAEEKLAELREQNEMDGPLFKMKHDPRITKVGRYLRKFSIDELPQLYNVLLGSMSMVGPRPALPSEVEEWDEETLDRLRVMPGLTGMWQVSGRSDSTFEVYKRMDLYYVDNWSLVHDVKICARTVGVVLKGSGAS